MRITRLKLENWRNFRAVDVPLSQRVFIVGPNASGKSNLLDALRFLRDIAVPTGGLRRAIAERGGMSAIVSLYGPGEQPTGVGRRASWPVPTLSIEVHVDIGGEIWRYGLVLARELVLSEEVDGPTGPLLRRPSPDDRQDPALLTQTHLEQISANKSFRRLAELLSSIEYTHLVPELVRQPRPPTRHGAQSDAYGTDLLDSIGALPEDMRRRRLERLTSQLVKVVPQLRELLYMPDERGTPHLGARFVPQRGPGTFHSETQLSDGTLRLMGLLWILDSGSSPLLLEEPEMSLHASAVRQIPQLLAAVAARTDRQILVSTHSEEMLSDTGIDPSEVLILTPTDLETRVSVGADDPTLIALAENDAPLGGLLVARTRPAHVEQLARAFGDEGA